MTNLQKAVQEKSEYKFTSVQLKAAIHYMRWVDRPNFIVDNPTDGTVKNKYNKYIWIETVDKFSKRTKIYFSPIAVEEIVKVIDDENLHEVIFKKRLIRKKGEQ
ncbi:hypothetical protein GKODMF_05130 [Candidatus Electrothrix gigas]